MPTLGCGAVIASPPSVMAPWLARSSPAMARNNVDFPQPEPPITATIWPRPISAENRSSALTPLG